jgi:hypothetical protein
MAFAVVGQLLFDGRPGERVICVVELLARGHVLAVQFAGVALGCPGSLDGRPDHQRRAENG